MAVRTESLAVPSYLCNGADRLSLTGLAGLFQEAAWQSAAQLGFAFTDSASPVYWVLSRLTTVVNRMPRWDEEVTVSTWPSGTHRLYGTREYLITAGEERLVAGGSAWIIVDAATGRPSRPERHLELGIVRREYAVEHNFEKLEPLPACDGSWQPVQPVAIDRNGHVNNTRYLDWFANWAHDTAFEPFVRDASGSTFVMTFSANTTLDHEYRVCGDFSRRQAEAHVRSQDADNDHVAWMIRLIEPEQNADI